jgi:SAM-dependent methyltransferase
VGGGTCTAVNEADAHNRCVSTSEGYVFDNRKPQAGHRFDSLSELFDPCTFRHLAQVGLRQGWRVWEVGAGGPSVPQWLADQVEPTGRVLATDIDTRWLAHLDDRESIDVRRHDVGVEPPPDGPFDLVHARLLLVHVPARERALAAMASVLRPGGWLVIEEADPDLQGLVCLDQIGPAQALANRLKRATRDLLTQAGVDLAYGRTLPRRLRAAGLVNVVADAYFPLTGPACTRLEYASMVQIRDQLIAAGLATPADIDQHLTNVATGQLDLATSPLISAWGQKWDGAVEHHGADAATLAGAETAVETYEDRSCR